MIQDLINKDHFKKDGAILISNILNRAETKALDALLAYVWHFDDFNNDIHRFREKDLRHLMGNNNCKNTTGLKEILNSLVETNIKWNEFGKKPWGKGASALLASFEIKDGMVSYSFSPHIKKYFLSKGETYTRLRLSILKDISSSYAAHIYQIGKKYFDLKRNKGETPWYSLAEIRKLLGIPNDRYVEYKHFKNLVLKTILDGINGNSKKQIKPTDLFLDIEYRKTGRKITSLKLHFTLNEAFQKAVDQAITQAEIEKKANEEGKPTQARLLKNRLLLPELTHEYGIKKKTAEDLVRSYSYSRIKANLEYAKQQKASGRIKLSLAGYAVRAIKQNYVKVY